MRVQCSRSLVTTVIWFEWYLTQVVSFFVQKQSDLLLNADDLDAMWVCLRENCVIDDATNAEKVSASISIYALQCQILLIFLYKFSFCSNISTQL